MLVSGVGLDSAVRGHLLGAISLAAPLERWSSEAGQSQLQRRQALEQLLYSGWFTRPPSAERAFKSDQADPLLMVSLPARLRASHAASDRFEGGWSVRLVGHGGVLLAGRAGESLQFAPSDYVNLDHPGAPVRVGDALAVTARRDLTDVESGWWMTWADAGPAPPEAMVRVYWNCPAPSVADLVAGVTAATEALRLPYTLKCPVTVDLFDRVDSVVLYLGVAGWSAAKPALRRVHASMVGRFRSSIPPLTLPLGRGAAAAEDPADGRSFGQSRVEAVADGVIRAADRGVSDDAAILDIVSERLVAHDIAPDRPYMRARSPRDQVTGW